MSYLNAWTATFLAVHTMALIGAILLYRQAPCWIQRMVVGLAIVGFFCFVASDLLWMSMGWDYGLSRTGYAIEHLAVLLWIFRIHYQQKQDPAWANSSAHSRS